MSAVQLASRVIKAKKIIAVDVSDRKLELAEKVGATAVVNPVEMDLRGAIDRLTGGKLVELAVDFVGRKTTVEPPSAPC